MHFVTSSRHGLHIGELRSTCQDNTRLRASVFLHCSGNDVLWFVAEHEWQISGVSSVPVDGNVNLRLLLVAILHVNNNIILSH